jgi:hypothetical protein
LPENKDFIENFIKVFLEHSYNNVLFAYLALHLILGRCTYNVRIYKKRIWLDGRISFWYLSPPSSGKSTPYDFMFEIIKGLGECAEAIRPEDRVGMFDVDDTSDAMLIGYHEEEGKGRYVPGILDRGGVVHWDEAAMLLGTSQYAEKLKGFLQKTLNAIGSNSNVCNREFKNDKVRIRPICSLYLTSYFPKDLIEKVLGTGLFQRVLLLPKRLRTEDRRKNSFKDIEYLGTEITKDDLDLNYFIEFFRELSAKFNSREIKFDYSDVKPIIRSCSNKMLDLSKNSSSNVRDLMETFQPRYMDQLYIIAMHHACIRGETKINVDDITYAYGIVAGCYSAILGWLEEEPEVNTSEISDNSYFAEVVRIFKKKNTTELPASEFIEDCCKFWNRTDTAVKNRLQPMLQNAEQGHSGLVKTKKGSAVFYTLQITK